MLGAPGVRMAGEVDLASHRADPERVIADFRLVESQEVLTRFLTALSSKAVVLNPERQIVWATRDFLKYRNLDDTVAILGRRFGEVLGCIHAFASPAGCGAEENCSVCGALQVMLKSRKTRDKVNGECRLTVALGETTVSLDLEVTATPWDLDGRSFLVVTVRDTSDERRRKALERIFFHDVVNSAGGLSCALEILSETSDLNEPEAKDLLEASFRSSRDLMEEVLAFRHLKMAETSELEFSPVQLENLEVLKETTAKIRFNPVADGKVLRVIDADSKSFVTDRLLLERVLINMLKNALEATPKGGEVGFRCEAEPGFVVFHVHNAGEMPREVQLQIFQRSFSTKSPDRGLGTYSMKLIGEGVLGGQVNFSSGPDGTDFSLRLPERPRASAPGNGREFLSRMV